MKFKITQKRVQEFVRVVIFLSTIVFVFNLFPRKEQFRYHFQIGKPWQYELLTAAFDFPVYKSEALLKQERDSALGGFAPYFRLEKEVAEEQLAKFKSEANLGASEKEIVGEKMIEIYNKGIIGTEMKTRLEKEGITRISVINQSRSHTVFLEEAFTIRSAYEYLLLSLSKMDEKSFRKLNLNYYLNENLKYEEEMSQSAREDILRKISLTSGLVQIGERIVDRGEIVDKNTYQVLSSLKTFTEAQKLTDRKEYVMIAGEILFLFGILISFAFYLSLFRPKIFASTKNLVFMMIMIVLMVALSSFTVRFTDLSVYIVPFALQPIIVRIFFDSRTALFMHIITVLLVSYMAPFPLEFLVLQITAGMTAVSSLKNLTQRSQLVRAAILIFVSYSVMYSACVLMFGGAFKEINPVNYGMFALNAFFLLFAYGLIYIFEKLFGFLSDLTLVELSNVNSKLLIQFSESAPGSFQHSLQVSNLATEAAKKINANVLLVRTGALYHDIGKMSNPIFFTENQPANVNPLAELGLEEAAKIIINHVDEGVRIAEKNNLPTQIIDFIKTHHGKNKTRFFYNSFKNKFPDREIPEEAFTYKGPLPNSKETSILMMVDAIEATSRSLSDHSEESIDKMVESIIDGQIAEGAFKNAPITFKHVEIVKSVVKEKLKNIYHVRISYPELKEQKTESLTPQTDTDSYNES